MQVYDVNLLGHKGMKKQLLEGFAMTIRPQKKMVPFWKRECQDQNDSSGI